MVFGLGLQPYRGAVRQQQVKAGRVGHQAAGRSNHCLGVDLNAFFKRPALIAAVGAYAIERLDFGHAAAGKFFDLLAQLHKGKTQVLRQHVPQRGLARAAQANQCYARA